MSTIKHLILFILLSIGLSYSIDYNIQNSDILFIDNHFIFENSNATIKYQDSVFDIYRLEFISNDSKNIQYKIKDIRWVKSNHQVHDFKMPALISKSDKFLYKGCPMIYLDIFPYKLDENNNLYYIESLDIEFIGNNIEINGFCDIKENIINKNFIFIYESNQILTDTDYIIVTSESFNDAAENLKSIHSDLNVDIIFIDDIVNLYEDLETEYAIREYLITRINSEPDLNYLLILGDENIIPPIYNGSTPSDDFYTSSGNLAANPQLATGRIPVNDNEDANSIILKIKLYIENLENPIDADQSWRSNITLVADDENNPNPNKYPELSHTENSSLLYESMKQNLILNTLYGIDYIPIQNSDGLLHSDLTSDLINHINSGVSLINYIGHGNHQTLADEKILDMDRDINLIDSDYYKLPIWIVGTCSFGEYDGKDSMAEALLQKGSGAISVISTVRGIGETSNINYLTKFFNKINEYLENSSIIPYRLGDILKESKNNSSSEYLFHLFGDPALPLPFPKIEDNLINSIDELFIGEQSSIDIGLHNGHLNIFDAEQNIFRIYDTGDSIEYNIPGQSIHNDSFYNQTCFVTPLDASECLGCASLRIYNTDFNVIQNIFDIDIIQGINYNEDISGPNVDFFIDNNIELYSDDIVFLNNSILIKVYDESGINLMGGLGHDIRYWFNNQNDSKFIDSDSFNYTSTCGEILSGEFNIPLVDLNLGQNILYVEIWDNFNNRTIESISLNLQNNLFQAYDIYNFPNPFYNETYFTFKLSSTPVSSTISIFDLNGKKIKTLNQNCENLFCSVKWDGKDLNSKQINNGTYIYHLELNNNGNIFKGIYKITKLK